MIERQVRQWHEEKMGLKIVHSCCMIVFFFDILRLDVPCE